MTPPPSSYSPSGWRGTRGATVAYFSAFICLGLVNAGLGPTLPGLAEQTHSVLGNLGVLFAARSLGYLVTLHPVGLVFDRWPGHRWLGGALLTMGTLMLLVPLTPTLWGLFAVMLAIGAGEAALDVAGNTLLVWAHGPRAATYLNALHFFYGVGALLAPLVVASSLALGGGMTGAYWALAGILFPAALGVLLTRAPTAPSTRTGTGDGIGNRVLVVLLSALMLLAVGAEVSLGGWWTGYALQVGLTDMAGAALLTSVYWGGFAAGRLGGVFLSTRWLPRSVLVLHLGIALLAVGSVLIHPRLAWVAAAVAGWGIGPLFATTVAFAGRRVAMTGRVASRLFTGAALGSMTMPWLAGHVLTQGGPTWLMALVLALLTLALAVVFVVISQDRRNPVSAGQGN